MALSSVFYAELFTATFETGEVDHLRRLVFSCPQFTFAFDQYMRDVTLKVGSFGICFSHKGYYGAAESFFDTIRGLRFFRWIFLFARKMVLLKTRDWVQNTFCEIPWDCLAKVQHVGMNAERYNDLDRLTIRPIESVDVELTEIHFINDLFKTASFDAKEVTLSILPKNLVVFNEVLESTHFRLQNTRKLTLNSYYEEEFRYNYYTYSSFIDYIDQLMRAMRLLPSIAPNVECIVMCIGFDWTEVQPKDLFAETKRLYQLAADQMLNTQILPDHIQLKLEYNGTLEVEIRRWDKIFANPMWISKEFLLTPDDNKPCEQDIGLLLTNRYQRLTQNKNIVFNYRFHDLHEYKPDWDEMIPFQYYD